ncbi:MAG: nucleoside triphosphate pyrophosphohydrolase [Oleispira sp.]|nr:nucleoside triphosphate pyrophosphohydrolase [Oleispira sp.]
MDKTYLLTDLIYLMKRLRQEDTGCPWDIKQTFTSIIPHTLEEAHEVAVAIEQQDWPHVEEELGDLLFQVIFYSQLGYEKQLFDFDSIVNVLVTKLIRRHPHVFPGGDLQAQRDPNDYLNEEEIKIQWQAIKAEEKALTAERGKTNSHSLSLPLVEYLQDIPISLPALTRAEKIQKKVSLRGFDWTEIEGVLAKVREELGEVEDEILTADPQRLRHEIGDLLFAVVNVARHLSVNPEQALSQANLRFSERYSLVAQSLAAQDRSLELGNINQVSVQEMETAWGEAKQLHPQLLARLAAANDDL